MKQVERGKTGLEAFFIILRRFRIDQHAGMRVVAADIPEFGMGDDPTLVIEQKGIIAAGIARKDHLGGADGQDMLGVFHQMPVIQGQRDHSHEAAFPIDANGETDDAPVFPAADGGFDAGSAAQLLLGAHVAAGEA